MRSSHTLITCSPNREDFGSVPAHRHAALQCDFDTARAALDDAAVDSAARATSASWWQQYCTNCGKDPWLRDTTSVIRSQLRLGFAARTCTGFFGKGRQVGVQTVVKALRHVAKAFVLEGYPNPRQAGAGSDLALPYTHILKSFRVRDPTPKPQQVALPVHAIDLAASARNDPNASPREAAMAFYFLMRVGEYTLPPGHRTTCTVQFCFCNICFWQDQTLLPPNSKNAAILAAASLVILVMDNQKNGQRGDIIHQEAVNANFCPVRSTAARVSATMAQGMPLTTPISFVQPGIHVQPPHILFAVRHGAKLAQLTDSGYSLSRIGAHLLRASGAMTLWLPGHGPEAIMKLGRWRTQTFLTYIHAQIAKLTRGTSIKMRQPVLFHNVGG
jgi:hypothetical protein